MPVITLPDGSQRSFDQPVSIADVAMDIGPGLAKAALAGKVAGELVDTSYIISENSELAIVTERDEEGFGPDSSLDGSFDGYGSPGAVSRRTGDHRTGMKTATSTTLPLDIVSALKICRKSKSVCWRSPKTIFPSKEW